MKTRLALVVLLILALGSIFSTVAIHQANGATYNWNFSISKLSQMANGSPAMTYNPHLGKMFLAYPSDVQCCGNVNVISSTDMITWTGAVDTSRAADPGSMGIVYNPDDQRMYIVYEHTPNIMDPTVIDMWVISSTDGSSWSNPVFITDIAEIANTWGVNGPTIAFDSTNHRLLIDYNTFIRNNQGDNCGCNEVFLYQSTGPVFNQSWSLVTSTPIRIGGTDIGLWDSPGMTFVNGKLYMAYVSQYDKSLHVIQSSDGITWTNRADFPGQSGYWVTIQYNPVEQSFHIIYVGVTNPFYLYDNSSPDAISWTGPTRLSGAMSAESLEDPTMAFVPTQNVLLLGFTGTDGSFGCPCDDGHLYTMPQVTPTDNAQYVSQTSPSSTMCTGQTATASITMKNTGTTTWLPPSNDPNPFRLGSQNPQDNNIWGFGRVDLSSPVTPGNQYTFQFTFTAPSTPGSYNFHWRMVQELLEWFGDTTPNVPITVDSCPSLQIDGSAQANCSHFTLSCPTTLSTTRQNDIIIVFTSETLDLATSCTFGVTDTAGLTWAARSPVVYGRYDPSYGWRDQLQEWWAKSAGVLSSDTITESISGCNEPYYGGEYNGLQVFAISGANFDNPFDPNSTLPGTGSSTSMASSATVSTSDYSTTLVFAGVQIGGATASAQSGFTMIMSSGGAASEYEIANGPLTNFQVTFGFSASGPWEEIADAVI